MQRWPQGSRRGASSHRPSISYKPALSPGATLPPSGPHFAGRLDIGGKSVQTLQEAGETLFAAFEQGELALPGRRVAFMERDWQPHSQFAGVALKHLLAAADTGGAFSYHLVRVEPGCAIGEHSHATQQETHEVIAGAGICRNQDEDIAYRTGLVSLIAPGARHAVAAGEEGLLLFAKFIPPLL